jgi:Phage stabilisation protein
VKSPFTLIKGDKVANNTDYRDALPVNMIAVKKAILGADGYMLCQSGLTQIATGIGADRGGVYNERQVNQYRVSGGKLISVNVDGTVTELGAVMGSQQVSMPYSFNTQAVIADGNMFLYDSVNGFRQITDPELGDPVDGVWVDGYYFLTDGEFIYHTDISDESSIDPLKFATAEFSPDPTLAVDKTPDNKVMVFGRYSLEYFENAATDNFAFSRLPNRAQKIGIVATHAKCELNNGYYIVGSRKEESLGVHQVAIGQTIKVSTREIDLILAAYTETELADIRVEGRMESGISLLLIHLPNETLCFNTTIATSFGLEAAWSYLATGSGKYYRGINGVFDANRGYWVYGDRYDTQIGKLDDTVFTQYGESQEWYLYTPLINIETQSIDELAVETIPGFTGSTDATVAICQTIDGITYSAEWWEMYGEPIQYNKRFIIRRLGYVNHWIGFRLRGFTTSRMAFGLITVEHG